MVQFGNVHARRNPMGGESLSIEDGRTWEAGPDKPKP